MARRGLRNLTTRESYPRIETPERQQSPTAVNSLEQEDYPSVTFEEAARLHRTPSEWRRIERLIRKIGQCPLGKINQQFADALAEQLHPHGRMATKVREFYGPLCTILNLAANSGLCPPGLIKRPHFQRSECVRFFIPDQTEAFINSSAPHLKPLFTFIVLTGARPKEAIYLDWRQINLSTREVFFRGNAIHESRTICLPWILTQMLEALPHRRGPVFLTHQRRPYTVKKNGGGQCKTGIETASDDAQVPIKGLLDLRSTWAVNHLAIHGDIKKLMVDGGWCTERMVRKFKRISAADLAEVRWALQRHAAANEPRHLPSCGTALSSLSIGGNDG